jgi:3-phenylpropionate/trans-cinnamate dioxygenase ferredoxin subunit
MSDHVTVALDGAGTLAEGEKRTYRAGDYDVLVCRVRGTLYAVENLCSHQESALCDGPLVGHLITCPKHNAQFDLRTGKHQGPPAWRGIARFEVIEGAQHVTVRVPARRRPPDAGMGQGPMIRTR